MISLNSIKEARVQLLDAPSFWLRVLSKLLQEAEHFFSANVPLKCTSSAQIAGGLGAPQWIDDDNV